VQKSNGVFTEIHLRATGYQTPAQKSHVLPGLTQNVCALTQTRQSSTRHTHPKKMEG